MATFQHIQLSFLDGSILGLLEQGREVTIATYHQFDGVYVDDAVLTACWTLLIRDAEGQKPWSNGYDIYAQFEGDTRRWEADVAWLKAQARAMVSTPLLPQDWREVAVDVFYGLYGHEDPARVAARWEERHADD